MRNIDWNYLLDKSLNLKTHNGDYSIRVPNLENLRNKKIFDLSKVLNEEDIKKIIENTKFNDIEITNKFYDELFEIIDLDLKMPEDVENNFDSLKFLFKNEFEREEFKERLPWNFDECKKELRIRLEIKEKQKQSIFKNLIDIKNEILREKGIWPLYLGFGLIRVSNSSKVAFYSPLVLKKVDLVRQKNRFFIIDEGEEPFLNKKINYLIKRNLDINLTKQEDITNIGKLLDDLMMQIKNSYLKNNKNLDLSKEVFNHYAKVTTYKNKEEKKLTSKPLSIEKGAVLGIFLNSTIIHEKLKELKEDISQKETQDQIIDFKDLKTTEQNEEIFKIVETNYSQQKAIIQSLNKNSVIWGPPGTGKTQTIVNLITNIMIRGKRALIVSEKQEALAVLLNKLNSLSQFCFFGVENAKHKKLFYDFLKDLPETYNEVKREKYNFGDSFFPRLKKYKKNHKRPYFNSDWKKYYSDLLENFSLNKTYTKINFLEWYKWHNFLRKNKLHSSLSWFHNLEWNNVEVQDIEKFIDVIKSIKWFTFQNLLQIGNKKDEIFSNSTDNFEEINVEWLDDIKVDIEKYNLETKSLFSLNFAFMDFSNTLFQSNHLNYWEKIHNANEFPQSIKKLKEFFISNFNMKLPTKRIWFTLFLLKRIKKSFKKEYKSIKNFLKTHQYRPSLIQTVYQIGKNVLNNLNQHWSEWKTIRNNSSKEERLTISDTIEFLQNVELKYQNILKHLVNMRNLKESLNAKIDLIKINKIKNNRILFDNFSTWTNNLRKTSGFNDIELIKSNFIELVLQAFKIKDLELFFNKVKKAQTQIKSSKQNLVELSAVDSVNNLLEMHKNNKNYLENIIKIRQWEMNEKNQNDLWHKNVVFDETKGKEIEILASYVVICNIIEKINQNPSLENDFKNFLRKIKKGISKIQTLVDKHKELINEIFPILIAVPENLALIYDWKKQVDYVIFDESSQVHTYNAIPFLNIAKNKIIVGDEQQMQPTNWFSLIKEKKDEEIEDLEQEPSLLQYATPYINSPKIMLSENYRSEKSALMYFSSQKFYNNELNILSNIKDTKSAIEVIDVGGEWIDQSNEQEALSLLNRVLLELNKPKNKNNKFIILAFNNKQLNFIKKQIFDEKRYENIQTTYTKEDGQIKIITSLEKIQGDEADIVFISLAYDAHAVLSHTYIGKNKGKNALNVAISRAKKKNIIFKSIYSKDVKTNQKPSLEIFKEWLNFIELENDDERKEWFFKGKAEKAAKTKRSIFDKKNNQLEINKEFQIEIKNFIKNEVLNNFPNLWLEQNAKESTYEINFVIRNQNNDYVLGIDAFDYKRHLDLKTMEDDFEKYKRLKQSKYPFFTIREIYFYNNREIILNEIKSKLRDV